ncbi:MAG: CBS domain-containing protein [Thiothrix sp.]|nr:MAG: CBS domain-containing protein [Thiothrix sp.]
MEAEKSAADYSLLTVQVQELVRPTVMVDEETSIQATAAQMTAANSHTALVVHDQKLTGIVTDQNFRARVVASQHDPQDRIASIMSQDPVILPPQAPATEAMLLMAKHNIRHIPIVDPHNQTILGVVGGTDLLRSHSHNAIYLIGDIYLAKDVETLKQLSLHRPKALVSMVKSLSSYYVSHAISSIGQAITRRLLQLAEQQLGTPPIPYAFLVAGSLARFEQTAYSDQDNGLILSNDYQETVHGEYFRKLADFVCDGLDACGYEYCKGGIMASNPQWRQPLSVWRQYFAKWIDTPDPQALLYSTIFFDLRCLYGEAALFEDLHQSILRRTQKSTLFLTHMAANALNFRPPLGFFKGFVLEKQANGEKTLDMKKRGVVPVIDVARVYALAAGLPVTNTRERLQALGQASQVSHDTLANVLDAFEFISLTRLRHQARQIEAGQFADNQVAPDELSDFEQRHLKNAFEVASHFQDALAQRYQANALR